MSKLEVAVGIIAIVSFSLLVIQALPDVIDFVSNPAVQDNDTLIVAAFIGLTILWLGLQALSGRLAAGFIIAIWFRYSQKKCEVRIPEQSRLQIGGNVIFEAKLKGRYLNGYLVANVNGQYGESAKAYYRYDEKKELGKMRGQYKEEPIRWRCPIPSDFQTGWEKKIKENLSAK